MSAARSALVIGGTGPTGPHLVEDLLGRGYEVTILHRGVHEPPDLPDVPHIHADPHFAETLAEGLAGAEYDVVLAMYGRTAVVAELLAGRCQDFVSISGIPVYAGFNHPELTHPHGMAVGAREDSRLVDEVRSDQDLPVSVAFARKILATEAAVHAHHRQATIFRFPIIYGPRNLIPFEWSVVKRVLDGRPWMLVPDGGQTINSRCAASNAAHAIGLALDQPDAARGEVFNVADDDQLTIRQWVEVLSAAAGRRLGVRSLPAELVPWWSDTLNPQAGDLAPHCYFSTDKLRSRLGYRDRVPAAEALARSAQWYLEHPVDPDRHPAFFDRFAYDLEDELVREYEALVAGFRLAGAVARPERFHAMPHPVEPATADPRGR